MPPADPTLPADLAAAPGPDRGPYYAKDGYVRKRSILTRNADSTTFTCDFRVCRMCDEVGPEAALMNAGDAALRARGHE